MGKSAEDYEDTYTEPELRERLKDEIKAGDKGGRPGQWSARKSQLLKQRYEAEGGGYVHEGELSDTQRHLSEWTHEDWQTADGDSRARDGDETRRYLPKEAWEELTPAQRRATDRKKREASRDGEQHVANTEAAKAARKDATDLPPLDELTVDEALGRLADADDATVRKALDREKHGKDRKTLVERLERALDR